MYKVKHFDKYKFLIHKSNNKYDCEHEKLFISHTLYCMCAITMISNRFCVHFKIYILHVIDHPCIEL